MRCTMSASVPSASAPDHDGAKAFGSQDAARTTSSKRYDAGDSAASTSPVPPGSSTTNDSRSPARLISYVPGLTKGASAGLGGGGPAPPPVQLGAGPAAGPGAPRPGLARGWGPPRRGPPLPLSPQQYAAPPAVTPQV